MKHLALAAMVSAALVLSPGAAAGADAFQPEEQRRAAFAGATLRLALDGRAAAPQARLGIGFSRYGRDGTGALVGRGGPSLPLEAGIGEGRLQFFVGGEPASRIERRLGADGSSTTALIVVGGLAVGVVAAVLLTRGDEDDRNPCPPGVEVCAF